MNSAKNQRSDCHLISLLFLPRLIFRPWRWRLYVSPKRRLTLNGLHGVISQKIVLSKYYSVGCRTQELSREIWSNLASQSANPTSGACALSVYLPVVHSTPLQSPQLTPSLYSRHFRMLGAFFYVYMQKLCLPLVQTYLLPPSALITTTLSGTKLQPSHSQIG
jgi:hypothetical protein